ncbi:hypothetical protein ANACOL_02628 [Anaerotruncus colihominis DSM 17241]|uniref:Uncharacterized protein n=1 Tax=Anaerotruncus colihominis DSM 17241 TaxID=445972 RepID=B0PCW6_9FIRM|nr:hypothetical protein ANACOL_02628 [Anaerotruncus colihominis DSM 17241]
MFTTCFPYLGAARDRQRLPHCSRRSLYRRSACPTVRGAACIDAAPAPLFAAQPIKVFCRAFFQKSGGLFSKRPEA